MGVVDLDTGEVDAPYGPVRTVPEAYAANRMRPRALAAILPATILLSACGQTAAPVAKDQPGPVALTPRPAEDDGPRDSKPPPLVRPVVASPPPAEIPPTPPQQPATADRERSGPGFVVPRRVTLVLGRETVGGQRTARLDLLVAAASNGCPYVGPLEHAARYSGDRLVVRIDGYEFEPANEKDQICTAVVQHASASIDVEREWLLEGDRTLVVRLRGSDNSFAFDYDDYYGTLRREDVSNVTLRDATVELFPMDVGELYLAGNVQSGVDYRERLREFAHEKGWEPADEEYEGIRQPHPDRFYVVVRNGRLPRPNHGRRAGRLEPGVHVYLTAIEDSARTGF